MNIKLFFWLIVPLSAYGMQKNDEAMSQIRRMEDARHVAGKFLACKPRTKLGESLIDPDWQEVNFCLINPNLDTFWHPEIRTEERYYYFHALNKFPKEILTRVISEKTLKEESLVYRFATQDEKEYILRCLKGQSGGTYTMEFSNRPEYKECCFTTKRLNPAHPVVKNALKDVQEKIKRYGHEELP